VVSRIEIMHLLHRLAIEQQKAILLSTHDIEQALVLSDKLWLLTKGEGLQCGVTEDLILNHRMDSLFTHRDIRFDYDHGVYYPLANGEKEIKVESEDPTLLHWAINALNRHGYQCVSHDCDARLVAVSPTELVYVHQGKNRTFHSFEDLMNALFR